MFSKFSQFGFGVGRHGDGKNGFLLTNVSVSKLIFKLLY